MRVMMPRATFRSSSICVTTKDTWSFSRLSGCHSRSGQWHWHRWRAGQRRCLYGCLPQFRRIFPESYIFHVLLAGVAFHTFDICVDNDLLRWVCPHIQDAYQDVIAYLEAFSGITHPVEGQVSGKNGGFHTENFCPDYLSATAMTLACTIRSS